MNGGRHAETAAYDFCDRGGNSQLAAPVDVLLGAVAEVPFEYGDPDKEGVPYDGREGRYQLPTCDTWDLLADEEVSGLISSSRLVTDGRAEAQEARLSRTHPNRAWISSGSAIARYRVWVVALAPVSR